jgi:hypothetical protein
MLSQATKHKGLDIPIEQIRFLDVRTGKVSHEHALDTSMQRQLRKTAEALAYAWQKAA